MAASEEHREIDKQYKRQVAKVRYPLLNGFAKRCLEHTECCDLRATQAEWLRELECRTVEVKDRDLEWRGLAYDADRAFQKDEMDRAIRIWLKIKAYHEIEDATTGIEWEIEREVAKREEREARERAWRIERAARAKQEVRLPQRWQTPSLVEITPASMLPKPPEQPIIRRR
jgi:hypothetical protein